MMNQENLIGRRVMSVGNSGKTRVPAKWHRQLADGDIPDELMMSLVQLEDGTLEVRVRVVD